MKGGAKQEELLERLRREKEEEKDSEEFDERFEENSHEGVLQDTINDKEESNSGKSKFSTSNSDYMVYTYKISFLRNWLFYYLWL